MTVKEVIKAPMSSDLIDKYLDGQSNIIKLSDTNQMTDIEQVFNGHDHVIILLEWGPQVGHWVALMKNKDKIYYFDSYGRNPFIYVKNDEYKRFNQNTHILDLIKNSKYKDNFYYNDEKYQAKEEDVATCGRWCLLSIILNKLIPNFDLNMFKKIVKNGTTKWKVSNDVLVSKIIDMIK